MRDISAHGSLVVFSLLVVSIGMPDASLGRSGLSADSARDETSRFEILIRQARLNDYRMDSEWFETLATHKSVSILLSRGI